MSRAARRFGRAGALAAVVLTAACASDPPAPQWKHDAAQALERATDAWLRGDSRIAELEFSRARAQLARTGRPATVVQAELLRCATRVAGLDFDDCPGFEALAIDATPDQRAYARYLRGHADAADIARLPATQRPLATAGAGATALASADDPLSALVAAGVAQRRGDAAVDTADAAIERASHQGWRRPLLAWLIVRQRHAADGGDRATAQRLQRRIDLLAPAAPPTR